MEEEEYNKKMINLNIDKVLHEKIYLSQFIAHRDIMQERWRHISEVDLRVIPVTRVLYNNLRGKYFESLRYR